MVNHSKKSRDKRYRYSRDRWCQNGVHNQKSEAFNNSIKTAFRSYTYIRPKFSKLYLNEWAFFRNLRHMDLDRLAVEMACNGDYARDGREAAKMEGGGIKNDISYSERCGDKEDSVKPPLFCSISTIELIRLMKDLAEGLSCWAAPHLKQSTHNTIRQCLTTFWHACIRQNASAAQYVTAPCHRAPTLLDAQHA